MTNQSRKPDLAETIRQSQALHAQGRFNEAAGLLLPAARQVPGNIDLQMLAGLSAREAGAVDAAIACFRQALANLPNEPQIQNILANTLAKAGRHEEALALFARLLERSPAFLDGHINQALTAEEAGDSALGLRLIEKSLGQFPASARLHAIKGALLKNLGRPDEALPALDQAIALEPQRGRTHLHRGVVLRLLGRFAEALEAYTAAGALGVDANELEPLRAAALLEQGEVQSAKRLYEDMFAAGDPAGEAGPALARINGEYLGFEDPLEHYTALVTQPKAPRQAWLNLLSARMEYRHWPALQAEAVEAAQLFGEDPELSLYLALGDVWAGDRGSGIDRLVRLADQFPDSVRIASSLAEAYLAAGDPGRAETEALRTTRLAPLDQSGWAWLGLAWRILDDPREAWLCDYDRFIIERPVTDPAGTTGPEEFAEAVSVVLDQLHMALHAPGNQSLREGTQTSGFLFDRADPLLQRFRLGLLAAIEQAITGLPQDKGHPLLSRSGADQVRLTGGWSVRLTGGQGKHVPHYHSEGWMSSAYYARLPQNLGSPTDGSGEAGYITFGAPPDYLGLDLPPRRTLRPKQGHLVMFPSYMWHGTVPFEGDDTRLTAAFDFVPR